MTIRKRGRNYHYQFWVNGRYYSGVFNGKNGAAIPKDKTEARILEALKRKKILDGTYDRDFDREQLRDFSTFVDKVYLPFAEEHHQTYDHDVFRCATLKQYFAGKRFEEITMMSVVGYINTRLQSTTQRKEVLGDGTKVHRTRSPVTVNKEVTLLSSIFRMAIKERVTVFNPCTELPKSVRDKIPARRKRNRRLSIEEERNLFEKGLQGRRAHIYGICEVALYTGMRRGELFRLKPGHINLGDTIRTFEIQGEMWRVAPGWLIITKSKNKRPRVIPMSRKVRSRLESLCHDATTGEYVFSSIVTGGRIVDIKKGFVNACLEVGIDNLTFHDLRHEWSSRAAEMGVPEHVRRDILGHSSATMTGDYTHASPEAMQEAMELVSRYRGRKIFQSRQNLDKRASG